VQRIVEGRTRTARVRCHDTLNTFEEMHALRKDYDFGVLLRGSPRIAKVHQWMQQGAVILEELYQLDTSAPMPLDSFMELAVHIPEALLYLHEKNIIHNAIHPR
jgi:hypothetical protein